MNNSVLVIGGGIAGMQSAIDLGNMGFQVYLVEKSPSIGGRMAQLDKTFPTNDCAMCILAPKMMECYRHPNVKVLTYSEVADVSGEVGDLKVKVLRKPKYIDEDLCTGCGDCAEACPVEVKSAFEQGMGTQHATYKLFAQAVPNIYVIDKKGISPCREGCPANTRVQGYVALISKGKFDEALEVVRDTLPFPAVCGRVCHHPCEDICNRKDIEEPVSTRLLHKFLADRARENGEAPPERLKPTKQEKIAIIGAGPAGLTCALRLTQGGYPVTIFEAASKAGGMIASCIPDYRNPKEVADYEINRILAHGIELKTKTRVGKDIKLKDIRKKYKAVFVAIGAQDAAKLPVDGVESKGVLYGLDFLRDVKEGKKVKDLGQKVVVIGGGNVGIDCAKTAVRLGAEVHLACLETRDLTSKDRMPAHEWEIEEAEEEGVVIHGSLGPKKIVNKGGRVTGMETQKCASVYAEDGRFAPEFSGEDGPALEADTVIIAVGQRTNLTGLEDIELTPRQTIKVDDVTLETNIAGVFAGGDIARGPASVVEAIAHGNEAAESIDRYISGTDLRASRGEKREVAPLPDDIVEEKLQVKVDNKDPKERIKGFGEVELGFTDETAVEEASRCLNCAICSECMQCVEACEAKAVRHDQKEEYIDLDVGAVVMATGLDFYDVSKLKEYGYGKIKNVITAMEYERLTAASGPTGGELERPSEGRIPENIVFIQCVGSRDFKNLNYCSSVCCMHATKEAIMAYEHHPGTKSTVLYMDMRAVGKKFQEYVTRAQEEYGVTYIRGRPGRITEDPETKNPIIWYEDTTTGEAKKMETELVVLAQAMIPSDSIIGLSKTLGIDLTAEGFAAIPDKLAHPLDSARLGIFACGYAHSPRDIPDSVVQGSGAAGRVAEVLSGGAKNA